MSFAPLAGLSGKMKTFLDRWTEARGLKVDNIDVVLSTRASSTEVAKAASYTAGRALLIDRLDLPISTVNTNVNAIPTTPIKSIQRGSISVTTGNVNVTITAVVMAKSTVNIVGGAFHTGAGAPNGRAQLTTTTNVQMIGGSTTYTHYWEVIEYE